MASSTTTDSTLVTACFTSHTAARASRTAPATVNRLAFVAGVEIDGERGTCGTAARYSSVPTNVDGPTLDDDTGDERPITMSAGLPSTVLPPADPDADARLAAAMAAGGADRKRAVSEVVAAYPRFLAAWADARRSRRAPDRALRRLPGRLPPGPRCPAGQRLARVRLRALGRADEPRVPALAPGLATDGGGDRRARRGRAVRPVPRPARPESVTPGADASE